MIAPDVCMPSINLGTNPETAGSDPIIQPWLDAGGVGIDEAYVYGNQEAVAKKIAGVPRKSIFIATKVPVGVGAVTAIGNNQTDVDCTLDANRSLALVKEDIKQLGVKYLDLVLLHAPCQVLGDKAVIDPAKANAAQWEGLQMALDQGLTRAIGVSNFNKSHMEALLSASTTKIRPALNQIHLGVSGGPGYCFPISNKCLHGAAYDASNLKYLAEQKIQVEGYQLMNGCPMHDEKTKSIAASHNMSTAQVCLRWGLQKGAIVAGGIGTNATKASSYSVSDLETLEPQFELTADDMHYLDTYYKW
jgi:diketogulonate reductase-like aldo/keto reductase